MIKLINFFIDEDKKIPFIEKLFRENNLVQVVLLERHVRPVVLLQTF